MERLDLSRVFSDPLADDLDPLSVDRRRVVSAAAFRRLQHKTQVFVAIDADHFRTRLTHTLEVADTAIRIARRLGLSAALAEVTALAHDLGHPPFGHAGERALDACLADLGGFEHNRHTLRVVEHLEHPYPAFRGLNLTAAVRACLAQHHTPYDARADASALAPVESAVVDWADRLTFCLHDLQDALHARLVGPEMLRVSGLWRAATEDASLTAEDALRRLRPTMDRMFAALLDDLADATPSGGAPGLSAEMHADFDALEGVLRKQVYSAARLVRMDTKAERIVREVFEAYVAEPRLLPERFYRRVGEEGASRVAGDYVAGMTDRFCQMEHARLFDARVDV